MTGKTGARSAQPAKSTPPAEGAAPKPQQRKPKPPAAPAPPARRVHRAGGWIDRGDGRGWELEE